MTAVMDERLFSYIAAALAEALALNRQSEDFPIPERPLDEEDYESRKLRDAWVTNATLSGAIMKPLPQQLELDFVEPGAPEPSEVASVCRYCLYELVWWSADTIEIKGQPAHRHCAIASGDLD